MTTIIFILELGALAVLIICGALLLLDAGSKKKQPEHKPEPQQPQRITKHPGRSKRRPKRADWPEAPERKEGGLSYGVYKDSNGQKNVQRRILPRRI